MKRLSPFRGTGKELKTLSKALAHTRYHINLVKRGGQYFHILRQESLERKNTLKAAQQARGMRWRTEFQPLNNCSEESDEEINIEQLFRQLCAIHWLLEASTLESNSSMHSILTCWNPTDPGGCKKTAKEMEEEKLAMYMWEVFITNPKKCIWKAQYSPSRRKINKTSTPENGFKDKINPM
ncbi:coiled-coil domain-containing protein 60 [Colius striatus]|uniref:coiled-coil domain-containing protein 60 n=1 Tax=Colius striatus TaxID=57412 RepID=UPI002B1D0163|nr:coiled-coil domain-containing protein 60 [Colius striatus]